VAGISNVTIRIGAETASAVQDINKVNSALGEQMTASQKASSAIKKAAVPAALAFTAVSGAIIGATKAAAEDADQQAALAGALKRTAGATDAQVAANEDYISTLSKQVAISDDELRPAMAKLAGATHSVAEGQKQLKEAADIAAAAHVPLAKAAQAVAAADAGRYGALKKLVPALTDATLKSKDNVAVIQEAATLTAGAGTDAANSYAGQQKAMQIAISETTESIGKGFLPILQELLPIVQKMVNIVTSNVEILRALLVVVGAVSGAILLANVGLKAYSAAQTLVKAATAAWTAAQWLLNAALDANPIGLVVIAVAALTAGVILAYKNSETFRDVVDALFDLLKEGVKLYITPYRLALEGLYDTIRVLAVWVRDNAIVIFRGLGNIIDDARLAATTIANYLTTTATAAFNGAATAVGALATKTQAVWDWMTKLVGFLRDTAVGVFNSIAGAVQSIADAFEHLIGWIAQLHWPKPPGWLRKIGSIIPHSLAVVPSVAGASITPMGFGASTTSTGAASPIVVNVFGAIDQEGTARTVRRVLEQHERRQGRRA
jgi:hypothetical protein